MKKLLIIFSLLFSLNALSQTPVPFSSLTLYTGSLDSVKYVGLIKAGNVWANRVFYGIDLVKGRLNISDTAAMLANYYAAIVQKVNISDTAVMLSPYERSADLIANFYSKTQSDGRYLQSVDSSNIPNFFLKVRAGLSLVAVTNNYNDLNNKPAIPAAQQSTDWNASSGITQLLNKPSYLDSFNLSTRANRQKGIDSIISLNYLKTAVTAVNAGYGISGGNITTTGTHSVDSFSLASRAYAQKIKDSLQANINTKLSAAVTAVNAGYGIAGGNITSTGTHSVDSFSVASRAYAQKIKDSLQANINGKLSSAVTSVATGYGLSGGTIINTGTLVADSFSLASRARVQKGIDSLQSNINAKGTVNSVATGFGLTGGTITNSGTLLTDSFSVATRARVQKAVDSLNANIGTKQPTLVSGTNIKTINGTTLLGSGDLVVGGSVDTFSISTRAFRDKLKDSLQANITANTTAIGTKMTNWIAGYGLTGGTISDGQTSNTDSFSIGTRAWRQKAVDSLNALINLKGSGTVTNITPGWGLTPQTAITSTGAPLVDSFSVASRARVQKAVDSLNGVLPNATNALNIAGVNFSFGGPGTQRSWSIGVSLPGQVAQMTAASSAINTTETKLMNTASIAANQLTAGSTYTVVLYGTCTSTVANASNIRVRIGTAGTTSDAVVGLITPTAATSGTGVNFTCTFTLKVRTTGVGGTMAGNGFLMNNGTTGISSVADVVGTVQSITVNTTAANIISVWYVSAATTTTSTFQDGIIKCEKI